MADIPDRPTREQVDEALAFADRYRGDSHTSVLAAEVCALRADLETAQRRARD